MKYQCEICGKTFDYEDQCKRHIEEHPFKDYYGKYLRLPQMIPKWFVPAGYILMPDGEYLVEGISIESTHDGLRMYKEHYPEETLKTLRVEDVNEIYEKFMNQLVTHLNDVHEETYYDWLNRRKE